LKKALLKKELEKLILFGWKRKQNEKQALGWFKLNISLIIAEREFISRWNSIL